MPRTESAQLNPGESLARDNGDRIGRSERGRLVRMTRRREDDRFVVTIDLGPDDERVPETMTTNWRTANAAFDELMHRH